MDQLRPCPCCGYRTGCRTCPVCYWTNLDTGDRPVDAFDLDPNAELTLSEARLNFAVYGASHRRYADLVRPPRAEEQP
jgi:hypothetical protein